MTYELCAPETLSAKPAESSILASLRERMEQSKTLGLTTQATFFEKELRYHEKKPEQLKPLTADEAAVWKAWLPTCYRDDQKCPDSNSIRKMSSYTFDRVPSPVLSLWTKIKAQDVFDYYEIWTPEILKDDPVLIGILGNERYLLARWGESDANFLNFADVAKKLWDERLKIGWAMNLEPVWIGTYVVCLACIYAFFFASGMALHLMDYKAGFPVVIFGIVPAVIAAFTMTQYAMKKWEICETLFIKMLFRLKPEDSWGYTRTEHLRAICRTYGKAPKAQ